MDAAKTTATEMEDIKVTLSSSKVNAALTEMARIKRDHPNDKIVVVSQFTSFLSVIQGLLREQGFDYVRLDGTMNQEYRADVIREFQRKGKGSPKVLLLSLKVISTLFNFALILTSVIRLIPNVLVSKFSL